MGRRFNILVGMALAVAVVVPFAFAQRQDPSAKSAAENSLNLDEPPIDSTPLPPLTESDAKGAADTAKVTTKARGNSKADPRKSTPAAQRKFATPRVGNLNPEP